jgi:phosphocarrier protein
MKEFKYVINEELGIHARPAGMLVKEANKFSSKIILCKDGKEADISRLLSIMALGVKKGETINVTIDGEDEDVAYRVMELFFKENL